MIGNIRRFLASGGAGIAILCILCSGAAAQGGEGILSRTDRPELREDWRSLADARETPSARIDKAFCAAIRTVEDLDERMALGDKLSEFAEHRAKPVEALLQGDDLERYRALIERLECEAAQNLMLGPYLIAHPEHACLFGDYSGQAAWLAHVASRRYPELSLCDMESDFYKAQKKLERSGIAPRPYPGFRVKRDDPEPLVWRDEVIELLIFACESHPPACVALVRISLETDAVRFTDEGAYYLLEKAKLLGVDDTEVLRLQDIIGQRLSPELIGKARDRARREAAGEPEKQ